MMEGQVVYTPKELGTILKDRRKKLKITQKTLANFCNLSHNGISKIEISESDVKLSTLLKMSKFLGFHIVIEFEQ